MFCLPVLRILLTATEFLDPIYKENGNNVQLIYAEPSNKDIMNSAYCTDASGTSVTLHY